MSAAWTVAGGLLLAPMAMLDCVFLTETIAGLAPSRRRSARPAASPRIAVLVPAHNEAATLGPHLAALAAVAPVEARILLVADNCSDDTARVARAAGVDVAERVDPARRGKGYALAFGRDRLAGDPPDVVIVLDADCSIEAGAVEGLAAAAAVSGRPVQGAYLFRSSARVATNIQISNFAIAVKNVLRQRGAGRIGAPALLTGSGMAFPWAAFAGLDLATGEVVEDLALGIDLVRRDLAPIFDETAIIWSDPSSEGGTAVQRARWEGGFLAIARAHAAPLVGEGIRRRSWSRLWMGLHLAVPPLTLLVAANVAVVAILGALHLIGMAAWPLIGGLAALAAIMSGVGAAWLSVGRAHLPLSRLIRLPGYVAWKLALHLRLASRREEAAWIRTERVDQDG